MLVAFSVTPIGTASTSVSDAVADAVRIVRESGLPNRTDSMFTTIEGEWDEVMAVVRAATLAVAARTGRASLVLKADLRPGVENALEAKVRAVEDRLAAD
ncbi:MAG: MTH1187 family thiamine-binding protein [Dehalococcoidia bacterium]